MNQAGVNHPSSELLALHAGGDLAAPEALQVESHLESCELCRAELAELASSIETFQSLAVVPGETELRALSKAVRRRTPGAIRWDRFAAAAAVLLTVASGLLWLGHGTRQLPDGSLLSRDRQGAVMGAGLTNGNESQLLRRTPLSPLLNRERKRAGYRPRLTMQAQQPGPPMELTLKEVSRQTETGEPTELRLGTSNPKVIVLWQMSDLDDRTEGTSKQ
jgi:hypothetical protein